jgi:hypothetical protein
MAGGWKEQHNAGFKFCTLDQIMKDAMGGTFRMLRDEFESVFGKP